MKVLLTCIDEPSHLRTMVPLAWALLAAGHEVRVAGGPGLLGVITGAGLPAVSVGTPSGAAEVLSAVVQGGDVENALTDWTEPFVDRQDWDTLLLRYQMSVPLAFGLYNNGLVDDLVTVARTWRPDLVLWESLTYAGPVAAAACGAAQARVNWMHDIYGAMRETFLTLQAQQPPQDQEDPLCDWFTEHLAPYGCDFDESLVHGQWTVDMVPPSHQFTTGLTRLPMRPVVYQGLSVLPEWVLRPPQRPRVCLSFGASFVETFGRDFIDLPAMVHALGNLDVEVVAAIPDARAAELRDAPSNLVHAGFVPLQFLLPTCAALIHHGGFGTWGSGLLAGVPQHITSLVHGDITVKGQHLTRCGAGILRHPATLTPEQFADDVATLVHNPDHRTAAAALADETRAMPSPAAVVAQLDDLVARP